MVPVHPRDQVSHGQTTTHRHVLPKAQSGPVCVPRAIGSYSDILELQPHGRAGGLGPTRDLQDGPEQDIQQAGHDHIYFLQHRLFLGRKKKQHAQETDFECTKLFFFLMDKEFMPQI